MHYYNQLLPGPWTESEETQLWKLQIQFGNKWAKIAELMPGRSENDVKNRYNSKSRNQNNSNTASGSNANHNARNNQERGNNEPESQTKKRKMDLS